MGATLAVAAQDKIDRSEKGRLISITEGGVLAGNSDNVNSTPFSFHTSLNWALTGRLSAGLGAGVEFLKETHLPVTANVMYLFGKRETVQPFVRLRGGYQFALEDKMMVNGVIPYDSYLPYYPATAMDARGGWLVEPAAGVILRVKQGLGISLSAGYRHQKLNYKATNDYRLHVEYNRLSLALGLIF